MRKSYRLIQPEEWLELVRKSRSDISLIIVALSFYDNHATEWLQKGLGIADILLTLGLDNETLAAAITYPILQAEGIHLDTISEKLGEGSRKLLHDVLQMRSLSNLQHLENRSYQQIENIRKMLLAMVTDVRAVLIILAERLWLLRQAKSLPANEQRSLAQETLNLYAPLANRMGVWHLKWEMEDLCLRYIQPETYSAIAKGIASRRDDREAYVERMIALLTQKLHQAGIHHCQVTGRVKHIFSIYNKMQRKNTNIKEIYDMSALRVMVDEIEDCYRVLSVLQENWEQISEEFDDYIANPKPNGYRSIHTVLLGPEGHIIEIQIRTQQMHHESELGVAAHWRYKEGVLHTTDYEAKIALLRQIIAWQKEVVHGEDKTSGKPTQDLFADRVYVFTPLGDIIDLPKHSTPVDFAYHIHSEVGHRCRGAKIDGNIVPLTYQLQTGDRVEILTAKQANPSRDWLNPQHGYLNTSRARAKLMHWFRVRDSLAGGIHEERLPAKEEPKKAPKITPLPLPPKRESSGIQILGVSNLLFHMARCCKPEPGDAIIGYITRQRGVSVHRDSCSNILYTVQKNQDRLIAVDWGKKKLNSA